MNKKIIVSRYYCTLCKKWHRAYTTIGRAHKDFYKRS